MWISYDTLCLDALDFFAPRVSQGADWTSWPGSSPLAAEKKIVALFFTLPPREVKVQIERFGPRRIWNMKRLIYISKLFFIIWKKKFILIF